jgi:tetratricopeptide (TPR) repeat protein
VPADDPDERLPTALTDRARSCDSGTLKALLLLEAAFLFDRLGRVRDAALAYEEAGRALPDFFPVVRGIRRIAVAGGEWQAACALYAHEAEVAADRENRAESLMASGEVALSRMNDPRAALLRYRRLLDLQPDNERAYVRATALYERLGDHGGLLDLLTARAAAITDPQARAALLRRQAELQRDHLNDARAAVATLKEAIALHPGDLEALLVLAPLEESQRWWQDAADHYRQVAELAAGTDTSRSARLKEAEIRERELGDREAARLILEELVVDPEDREAARYMALLCERMGRWDRARELYRQLAKTKKATDRADALVALAAVMETGFSDGESAARALEEAFTIALADPEVVRLLEKKFQASGDWRTFAAAGERACGKARVVAAPQVSLHLALARAYGEQLHRADLSERHLLAAANLVPHEVAPSVQLARLHLSSGRTDLALADFRRALEIDPFCAEALRGLGGAFLREGVPDAGRLLDEVAAYLEGAPPRDRPLGPLQLKRPLTAESRAQLLPRAHSPGGVGIGEILKLVEPYAPALLVEATGQIPRGDELPEANQVSLRCRSVAVALGVEPLRVFVDEPDGLEALLVADARLALCIGKGLIASTAHGRLVFEVARRLSWVASQATVGAFLVSSELPGFLQALAQEGGSDEVKELRRRVSKPLPRRLRKDAERIATEQIPQLAREAAAWYAEEQRWADRIAFLLCRDPAAAFDALGGKGGKAIRQSVRAVEILRFITTEACWRVYARLAGG